MNNKNIPDNNISAPAKKAENTTRNMRKIIESRSRARRIRSIIKLGMPKELIEEMFAQEDNRMILVLLNGAYTIEDGTKTIKVRKRDNHHKVVSVELKETPNILRGSRAAIKYVENEKMHIMGNTKSAIWILSDKDKVDADVEKLKILGRVSVTKPEKHTQESVKNTSKKANKSNKQKKPTNNTTDVKKASKKARKTAKMAYAKKRPYYAALRKGGVSARIKKYNPSLAKKIEDWLKSLKESEINKKDNIKKRDNRQMSTIERKANKRARKAIKHLNTQQRRKNAEKVAMKNNSDARKKRIQKAKKPVQTKLKMTA